MLPAVVTGLLGVAQGVRHAFEPDHVTAVTTVLVREPSTRKGVAYAAAWGLGHGAVLLVFGGALLALRVELSGNVSALLELAVAAMLIALGIRALRPARPTMDHTHVHEPPSRGRPFVIGLVHGLAGSGALAAAVAAFSSSFAGAILAIALYALGTTVGMSLFAGAAGPLFARVSRAPAVARTVIRASAAASILLGVVWAGRTAWILAS